MLQNDIKHLEQPSEGQQKIPAVSLTIRETIHIFDRLITRKAATL